jgi:hypothetical protein
MGLAFMVNFLGKFPLLGQLFLQIQIFFKRGRVLICAETTPLDPQPSPGTQLYGA